MMKYTSTVRNIETFLTDLENREGNNEDREEEKDNIERTRTWLNNIKTAVNIIYSNCEIGVSYSFKEDLMVKMFEVDTEIFAQNTEEMNREKSEEYDKMFHKFTRFTSSLHVLEQNNCLIHEVKTGNVLLKEKKPLEDLEISSATGGIFGCFDPEDLENAGIAISMQTLVSTDYTVIAGPEFIMMDLDDLIDYLSKYDEDDEDNDVLIHIRSCTILIHHILDFVKEKPLTIDELATKLFEEGGEAPITFDVTDEALEGTLNDMKKLGLITFKNGVIKLAK